MLLKFMIAFYYALCARMNSYIVVLIIVVLTRFETFLCERKRQSVACKQVLLFLHSESW